MSSSESEYMDNNDNINELKEQIKLLRDTQNDIICVLLSSIKNLVYQKYM
jgi:hypothetical protein